MSTTLTQLAKEVQFSERPSTNIAWGWQDPEDFVKDLNSYAYTLGNRKFEVTDLSGAQKRWIQLEGEIQKEKNKVFATHITPQGSNANWGHITKPEQLVGSDYGIFDAALYEKAKDIKKSETTYMKSQNCKGCNFSFQVTSVGSPVPADFDCSYCADCQSEESLLCKGCSKYFSTKGSLKRHHERKKSCKEICEKTTTDLSGNTTEIPEKPYIVDWIEQLQTKAISGDSDKPYCKHCDIEFASKSNLHKHLTKSVACDKLAKQEFVKLLA